MNVFIHVVDAGSLSSAAKQLDLTTSQVSRIISELEKRLDVKLMHRTTRQRKLTEVGEEYLKRCREIMQLVTEAEAYASGKALNPKGMLHIQCMASFGRHYIIPLLSDFLNKYPEIRIEYSTSQYLPNPLAHGIDVSIYVAEKLASSGLVSRKLGNTFSILCAAPAYLKTHGIPKTPDECSNHSCLHADNPSVSSIWKLINAKNQLFEIKPEGCCIADNPEVLIALAEAGKGIALVPVFSAVESIRSGKLVRILMDWRSQDIGIYTLMPSRLFQEAKIRVWIEYLMDNVSPAIDKDIQFIEDRSINDLL